MSGVNKRGSYNTDTWKGKSSNVSLVLHVGDWYIVRVRYQKQDRDDVVPVRAKCLASYKTWFLMQSQKGYRFTLNKFGDEVTITNG